jgi:8-amino-7-oxononanoate synthase
VAALIFGDRETAIGHWQGLLDAGIYTNLMIPPAAPSGKYIVRISLSAAHSDEDIDRILDELKVLAGPQLLRQVHEPERNALM